MTSEITPKKIAAYRATAKKRWQEKQQHIMQRHERACEVAQTAAQMLKEQYGVERVVVFGSVRFPDRFHERSDVDLAVWGLDERVYYRVVSRLLDIDPHIPIDLIEAEFASPRMQETIAREGEEI